ncbi:MAG: hypothetical protein D6701_10830 [Gemmatimonadetes bacterium]|nr:MAG: hypothetical protein D6701_10830 [Gemmatimonadota bacterium]
MLTGLRADAADGPVAPVPPVASELLSGRGPDGDRARAYVCSGFVCRAPVNEPDALRRALLPD